MYKYIFRLKQCYEITSYAWVSFFFVWYAIAERHKLCTIQPISHKIIFHLWVTKCCSTPAGLALYKALGRSRMQLFLNVGFDDKLFQMGLHYYWRNIPHLGNIRSLSRHIVPYFQVIRLYSWLGSQFATFLFSTPWSVSKGHLFAPCHLESFRLGNADPKLWIDQGLF